MYNNLHDVKDEVYEEMYYKMNQLAEAIVIDIAIRRDL